MEWIYEDPKNAVTQNGCTEKNIYLVNCDEIYINGCICSYIANKLSEIIKTLEKKYMDEAKNLVSKYNGIEIILDKTKFNNNIVKYENLQDALFKDIAKNNPIKVYITSFGGSLLSGFHMADSIRLSKIPVYTFCKGYVASAATLPFVYGKRRFMDSNSYFLIHQLRGTNHGKFKDLKVGISNDMMFMKNMKKIYKDTCNISGEVLDDLLEDDDWYDADTCLQLNIIDEII